MKFLLYTVIFVLISSCFYMKKNSFMMIKSLLVSHHKGFNRLSRPTDSLATILFIRKFHLTLYNDNNKNNEEKSMIMKQIQNNTTNDSFTKQILVGESCFDGIRLNNALYVDKTEQIYNNLLKDKGVYYFFVRPRRFGKSLLCSTISNLFGGNSKKKLFKDLWIYNNKVWNFEKENHPVIHLDMIYVAGADSNAKKFENNMKHLLSRILDDKNIDFPCNDLPIEGIFSYTITQLKKKHNGKNVVIIIDEYDKPVLDLLNSPEEMIGVRKSLEIFYSILKEQESNLRLVFITGLYKFTEMSMFPTLNNLDNISMKLQAGTLCGYTEDEVRTYFHPHIQAFKSNLNIASDESIINKLKKNYDGYKFGIDTVTGKISESVYNPFLINYIFNDFEYYDKWILSGSARMLSNKLTQQGLTYDSLLQTTKHELERSSEPSCDMSLTALAYYGGYTTIDKYNKKDDRIILKIPNTSVRKYLEGDYIASIFRSLKVVEHELILRIICNILINTPLTQMHREIKELERYFDRLISPYSYEAIMKDEKLFHIFLVGIFLQMFENVALEEKSIDGRIDISIMHKERYFVIECKYDKTAIVTLNHIKETEYFKKNQQNNLPILLLGINLNKDTKSNNKNVEVVYEYVETTPIVDE